jgi:hypothetical protein
MVVGGARASHAVLSYNTNVTPDVIMGSGIDNGGFTVDQQNGIEIGLRGKLRFGAGNAPENVFNFAGVSGAGHGQYTFAGVGVNPADGPVPAWVDPLGSTPIWNFEWSINTNFDGSTTFALSDLGYAIFIDFNPAAGLEVPAVIFDPINVVFADHSIGTNMTGNGAGMEAFDDSSYALLISTSNVAQQSWNMEFFDIPSSIYPFDPTVAGTYTIRLDAYLANTTSLLASSSIDVIVTPASAAVPEASSMALGSVVAGVLALGAAAKKRWVKLIA